MIRDGRIDHALAVQGLLTWLISELPESPLAPTPLEASRFQFHLRTIMGLVAVSAGLFGLLTKLGNGASMAFLWAASIPLGALLAFRVLDPPSRAILLRNRVLSVRYRIFRLLAMLGLVTLMFVIGLVIIRLIDF